MPACHAFPDAIIPVSIPWSCARMHAVRWRRIGAWIEADRGDAQQIRQKSESMRPPVQRSGSRQDGENERMDRTRSWGKSCADNRSGCGSADLRCAGSQASKAEGTQTSSGSRSLPSSSLGTEPGIGRDVSIRMASHRHPRWELAQESPRSIIGPKTSKSLLDARLLVSGVHAWNVETPRRTRSQNELILHVLCIRSPPSWQPRRGIPTTGKAMN